MLSILMLPFMCLSMANGEKLESKTTSLNEISSITGDTSLKTKEYQEAWASSESLKASPYINRHNEGSANNDRLLLAEKLEFSTPATTSTRSAIMLNGSLSSSDTIDYYYFNIPDRSYVWINFLGDHMNSTGEVLAEEPSDSNPKLFDIGDDSDKDPTATLKKGAYYLRLKNPNNEDIDYKIRILYLLQPEYTVTFDEEFMNNNNVLVWESDFLPKASKPVDDTTLYRKTTGKIGSTTAKVWLPIRSCSTDYEGVYRYICFWKKNDLEKFESDLIKIENAIKSIENQAAEKKIYLKYIEKANDVLGVVSYVVGIFNGELGIALSTINLATTALLKILGNGVEYDFTNFKNQITRYKGVFDAAIEGTVVTIREQAYIERIHKVLTHGTITTYKLRFKPYLLEESYNPVIQKADIKGLILSSNLSELKISSCQGTFKTVNSLNDIDSLYSL